MTPTVRRQQRRNGFTLVELLMVIVILGFLVGMVMPFANHQDKQTKIKQTNAIFEDIRMAILGARNSFDAEGNRVIGGYVGDVGHLPKLYVFKGKDNAWDHDVDSDNEPDTTTNYDSDDKVYGKDNAEPVALWRNTLKVANGDYPDLVSDWEGPYMASPRDPFPDDSIDDWETETGEKKKQFRLRECQGRLTDGWGKALIIYVEDEETDSDGNPKNLVFVSAGPDGRYNADDPADTDNTPEDDNTDNLVMRISNNEWDTSEEKNMATQKILLEIKRAIIGQAPTGLNDGYTGDLCQWPELFYWREDVDPHTWDDEDSSSKTYTKGQPRGLWTYKPNSQDSGDDIPQSDWSHPGIGWRHSYIQAPWETGKEQSLKDAWGREILFFKDSDNLLILSRGTDGKFTFGEVDANSEEPKNFTEVVDISSYAPHHTSGVNKDNITLTISKNDWKNTVDFKLKKLVVLNANSTTRAELYRSGDPHAAPPTYSYKLLSSTTSGTWQEEDADGLFKESEPSQGTRILVIWQDANTDGLIDAGETALTVRLDVVDTLNLDEINVDTDWFKDRDNLPLP